MLVMKLLQYIMCASLALALAPLPSLAVSKNKKFSLAKLSATYKNARSLEADMLQEVYQASLAKTKTSKGSLKLAKPNFVRWEIYEPDASVMVSNGRKLSYFTPDARGKGKGQVIEKKASELNNQPLFQILTGSLALEKAFNLTAENPIEGIAGKVGTELVLAPIGNKIDLTSVTLRVNPKYLIEEIILENTNGNRTKITLQNQTLGAKLPPPLFDFKPPADTEILQN